LAVVVDLLLLFPAWRYALKKDGMRDVVNGCKMSGKGNLQFYSRELGGGQFARHKKETVLSAS